MEVMALQAKETAYANTGRERVLWERRETMSSVLT